MLLGAKEPNRNYTVYGKFNLARLGDSFGADDLIQLIGCKVILCKNVTT